MAVATTTIIVSFLIVEWARCARAQTSVHQKSALGSLSGADGSPFPSATSAEQEPHGRGPQRLSHHETLTSV